jgi:hypothetical protein
VEEGAEVEEEWVVETVGVEDFDDRPRLNQAGNQLRKGKREDLLVEEDLPKLRRVANERRKWT